MAGDLYAWLKAFHVIAVIAWMAGMLYLPRLFAYHAGAEPGSTQSETFKVMERRLLRAIINPSMIVSIALGAALISQPGLIDWSSDFWIYPKLAFVVVLLGLHGMLSRWRRDFENDRNRHSARFYRIMNEAPTLPLMGIVILVIVKPF